MQKLQKGDPVIFVWTAPHAWIDKHVTRMRRVDITIIILYYSPCRAACAAICLARVSMCACVRACAHVCARACACVVVAAASTEPTNLRFPRRFTLSESIRYKLSRIQLPEYKGTCHTTNVSRSGSFFRFLRVCSVAFANNSAGLLFSPVQVRCQRIGARSCTFSLCRRLEKA